MSVWDRLKVIAVLLAISAFAISMIDVFFSIYIDMLNSPIQLVLMLVVFWFVAPWVAKYIKVGKRS